MKSLNRALAVRLFLVACLVACGAGWQGGCSSGAARPTPAAIDNFARASNELAHDTETAVRSVRLLYETKVISLEVKDQLALALKKVAENGGRFNELVARLDQQDKAGTLPDNWYSVLLSEWEPVTQAFKDVTQLIRGQPGQAKRELEAGTAQLKQHVNTIEDGLKP